MTSRFSGFSSPFSGTFFQFKCLYAIGKSSPTVFVPFLGDFFSIVKKPLHFEITDCFRPLSRGLFFNDGIPPFIYGGRFSSPFSGTFFQWKKTS